LGITRQSFYPVERILQAVAEKIDQSEQLERAIDFLTLVPDGEPTLDINLGKLIEGLKKFRIPIAVISNSALIDHRDVQDDLLLADWVSVKVDAIDEADWRKINRPHQHLSLPAILAGILEFRDRFHGELVTETMLVAGVNDHEEALEKLSAYLLQVQPYRSYLSIPTRPPAETWVRPPDAVSLEHVFRIISEKIPFMHLLFETDAIDFQSTGNLVEDILSTSAVHPLREEALKNMVLQAGGRWELVEELVATGKIVRIQYREEWFYVPPRKSR
jgi:wyosine [tRNA(Phe)-imidazoG37] synthetase (radical SAM superfamily)